MPERLKYPLILVALSFIIYANTLHNAFVSDDIPTIINNPSVGEISLRNFSSLSVAINYRMAGLKPFVYHLTNIILHATNSVLVFFFLLLFFRPAASFWGSLIFAVHPVQTEAVTWISGRGYVLFTLLLLGSFLLYTASTSVKKLKWPFFWGSLVFYLVAISANTFSLIYPAMIVLYDLTFRKWQKFCKLWLPFFGLTLIKLMLMLSIINQRITTVGHDTGASSLSNPLYNIAFSFFAHLKLLFWPKDLTLYHEPLAISRTGITVEIILLVLIILCLPLMFKKAKELFFAVFVFILFLSPTYSPVMITWLVAERYLYFPSLALCIFAAFLVDKYHASVKSGRLIRISLIILVCFYSVRTYIRNFDWKSHASIWRATVKVSPLSPKAHNNMGDVFSLENDFERAAQEFNQAIKLNPRYADAYHNLAYTYEKMGKIDEAVLNYKKATTENPLLWQSYQNLARIYFEERQVQQAEAYLKKAREAKKQ